MIQFAHGNSPAAAAVVIKTDTFAFIDAPTDPLRNLPWSTHDCGAAETLLDLFDAGSQAEVSAAMSRAHLASIGITTVRSLAGQPVQLAGKHPMLQLQPSCYVRHVKREQHPR